MRTTSNPVVRRLLVSTSSTPAPAGADNDTGRRRRLRLRAAVGTERPLTVDDVVTKTAIALGIVLVAAVLTAVLGLSVLLAPAALAALGLTVYSLIRPRPVAAVTIGYSVAEGIVLGSVVETFEAAYDGIVTQAVIGTCGVFVGMLIVYRTRILRVTPKLAQWVFAAVIGVLVLSGVNAFATLVFGTDLGIRGGGVLSIVFSLVFIAVAAASLLLNFRAADQMIHLGVSEKWAWYLAFGLVANLVWLYLEILWLLASFR